MYHFLCIQSIWNREIQMYKGFLKHIKTKYNGINAFDGRNSNQKFGMNRILYNFSITKLKP